MNLINDFISLLFPRTCQACNGSLKKNEEIICTACMFHLPKTNYHLLQENQITKTFWGRVNIQGACALFYYQKGGKVQHLIHQLKYKGQKEIGIFLGNLYGYDLLKSPIYSKLDLIIPIPLHKSKLKKRSFNQSELFAKGLSRSMKIETNANLIKREIASTTQTKKSRYERWKNVSQIFSVSDYETLMDKNILIVDDVITTGATMEACVQSIQEVSNAKIYLAAIGFASD